MRPIKSRIVLVGITLILTVGVLDASTVEPVAGLQSVVKQLGSESDFAKNDKVFLPDQRSWGKPGKDGQISYRKLKAKAGANLLFAAFDVDANGFCKSDMILEIFYRDDFREEKVSPNRVKGRVAVKSRIDFAKENEYVEIGHLKAEGDGKWKLARIFWERTPRQMLRAIDGSFQFRIVMPKSGSRYLPISYVRLISIDHQEFVKLRENDRAERGLERIDYEPPAGLISIPKKWKGSSFVVYPVNYLKLVFPNSAVDYDHVGDELRCFEVPGQAEPVSFVIHAFEDLSNVEVKVSNLYSEINTIPADMIHIRRVICNDQRWGWGWSKRYGLCPDYLSFANHITDIKANANCQLWLTINIPEGTTPGLYTGKITISSKEKHPYHMPLSVEVLPIRLLENKVKHMVYHSPFYKNYQKDHIAVLEDMKSHGLTPISYPKGHLIKTRTGDLTVRLDGFEHELQLFKKVYPQAKIIFIGLQNFSIVWSKLNGPKPRFQRYFPQFESTYGRILLKYAELARSFGFEPIFTFVDEPAKDPYKRRIAYLCSSIAQKRGLKTWVASYVNEDEQLSLSTEEISDGVNYLRPLSEVLDILVYSTHVLDQNVLAKMEKYNLTKAYYTTYLCTSVRPVYNRFLNGIYPFAVDVRHVLNYAYRDDLADPYDDMDVLAHRRVVGMNDYLLTYPAWNGEIVPTLAYEALREGVEDADLLGTLQVLIAESLLSNDDNVIMLAEECRDYIDDILTRLNRNFRQHYLRKHTAQPIDNMEKVILRDLNNEENEDYEIFNKIRRGVCDRIIELQNVLSQRK